MDNTMTMVRPPARELVRGGASATPPPTPARRPDAPPPAPDARADAFVCAR